MKPKISVIIPCYNSENFITRCAQSLINQTIGIENLELIFINDGSTDNTLIKLNELETLFPNNIMVIDLGENLKQGTARNIGIQYANADYIGFVDSDDWIEESMYEKLYMIMQQYNCDIVGCCLMVDLDNSSIGYARGEDIYLTINSIEDRKRFLNLDIIDMGGGFATKIYRKSLIIDYQIFFPEQLAYEDNYWFSMVKLHAKSIYIIKENLYHYCKNKGSTTNSLNAEHHFDRLKIELLKLETYKEMGVFDVYYDEFEFEFLKLFYENTLHILLTQFSSIRLDIIDFMQRVMIENFPNYKNNPYLKQNQHLILYKTIDKKWNEELWYEFANNYREILAKTRIMK